MALPIYDLTIPVFIRGLGILAGLLAKGEAHAHAVGRDPGTLVDARLAPDMLSLAGQVQRASDTAKLAASRLSDRTVPAFDDVETTFANLQDRIERTVALLRTFDREMLADGAGRAITMGSGDTARQFTGESYVLTFALPNFFFHVATAYDILRHNGVPIGKRDYLWPHSEARGQ